MQIPTKRIISTEKFNEFVEALAFILSEEGAHFSLPLESETCLGGAKTLLNILGIIHKDAQCKYQPKK